MRTLRPYGRSLLPSNQLRTQSKLKITVLKSGFVGFKPFHISTSCVKNGAEAEIDHAVPYSTFMEDTETSEEFTSSAGLVFSIDQSQAEVCVRMLCTLEC
jgi:hypothetical protein